MEKKIRIVQCITRGDTFYGAQSHFLDICELLHRDGHEVTAVVGSAGLLTERLQHAGVPVCVTPSLRRSIHPARDIFALRELRRCFRERAPQLVATHSSKAGILGRWAAQKEKIPNIFTAHGWSFEENIPAIPRNLYLRLERWVGKRTDGFIAVSDSVGQLGVKCRVARPEKIHVVLNAVNDFRKLASESACDFQQIAGNASVKLLMVAGFRKQKDHTTLLRSLAELRDQSWELDLLGDGPLLGSVRELSARLGLSDRVHFRGAVTNVPDYLRRADIMVLSTHWEGLPLSIMEGLSAGLPTVATDVSGVREEVVHEKTGLLVDHVDVGSLRDALRRLIESPDLRQKFGANARRLYEQQFHPDIMYQNTLRVYRYVLDQRSST